MEDNVSRKRIVMGFVGMVVTVMMSQSPALSATGDRSAITITTKDRSIGSAKAPIVMVEYASLSCLPCARFNIDVLPLLKAKYIDTGKVYYVFRVFPLNPIDVALEAMARCLPTSKYMRFIDMLYRNQKEWDPDFGVTDVHGAIMAMGRMAGMNTTQADQCIENKAEAERATKVGEEAQERYNITGAPAFVVNGQVHVGEFRWQELQKLLDSLVKKK